MLITRRLTFEIQGICQTGPFSAIFGLHSIPLILRVRCFNAEAAQEAQNSFGPRCLRPTEGRKSPWGRWQGAASPLAVLGELLVVIGYPITRFATAIFNNIFKFFL